MTSLKVQTSVMRNQLENNDFDFPLAGQDLHCAVKHLVWKSSCFPFPQELKDEQKVIEGSELQQIGQGVLSVLLICFLDACRVEWCSIVTGNSNAMRNKYNKSRRKQQCYFPLKFNFNFFEELHKADPRKLQVTACVCTHPRGKHYVTPESLLMPIESC